MKYVVLAGDLVRGYEAYGPFETEEGANNWIERVNKHSYSDDDVRVMQVLDPT